ncbi:3-ketosteroid-delta-1-dehydrogenase [Bacillus pacificus]|uniref:3-ketosteroid-delta-1-dehydrogenase n=1 Tax=Bacillus TaxID=1386 RepID=UPI0009446FEE|nr:MULTISPECIES: 3-ketosteroid-delta-1-dehydrogenase [Bacillus]MBD0728248.1 3-ketosteroid-delta-1-dehydrogenase [Bacillus cereus]MCC2485669.1 3-ketosteroid-delta-1-dehydrogenase [Bacillus pacificus]MCU4738979.1 3-ketosteroid-delta-1-dehydrogenase [Bacillus paranthracis]MCU4869125.1 3-ketosteroid-delta-1-dehydrogenase [Bacillus paranthracis]MCU5075047.1 3-ketosteroid-delta-1-dehydrogenase [Bacillus paranthracis]
MIEEKRSIKGYEEQYDITRSGRIIIKKTNQVRHKKGNRTLCRTFEIWKQAFPDADISEYKGLK